MSLYELRRKTNEAVARRWLASKHWGGRRVGMQDVQGRVCVLSDGASLWFHCGLNHTVSVPRNGLQAKWLSERVPDLDHPGTRAFLLEDVRRAWGDGCTVVATASGASVYSDHGGECLFSGNDGEAEALIAALEAAP